MSSYYTRVVSELSMCNQIVTSEIREKFHARFVQIIRIIWTKRKRNYSLISRVYHLITYEYHR